MTNTVLPKFKVVIPARYASTRLPGKPLLDIAGKPMVIHVVERSLASGAEQVIVATDHDDILDAVRAYGYDAVMTQADHVTGTDRIAEVARMQAWSANTIVVNVQGDEPLIAPALIQQVATHLDGHPQAAMSTACHAIHDTSAFTNPNVVKVVMDTNGYALYFSRAPIPYPRDAFASGAVLTDSVDIHRHIGIYAYRAHFLRAFASLQPAPIEQCESLEQLRALWHGYRISVAITENSPASGVDTKADLEHVRTLFN